MPTVKLEIQETKSTVLVAKTQASLVIANQPVTLTVDESNVDLDSVQSTATIVLEKANVSLGIATSVNTITLGNSGPQGTPGINGTDGTDGAQGIPGERGEIGPFWNYKLKRHCNHRLWQRQLDCRNRSHRILRDNSRFSRYGLYENCGNSRTHNRRPAN